MNRRTFITWMGVGGLASYLPVALVACSSTENTTTSEPARPDGFQAVGTVEELDKNGVLMNTSIPAVVIPNSGQSDGISALNPTCTHLDCTVEWQGDKKEFFCPCHDSRFAADGKVLQGPADRPLALYEIKQEGDLILIKTS
jgi:cytochrome b6-f complex iron-sulfur subunit